MNQRLRGVVAEALHLTIEEIGLDASSDTLEAWDSLAHLEVVLAVEQEFGLRFSTEEIPELISLQKLSQALVKNGAL